MNITKNKLPDWFDGTIYDAGDNVTNPFTGEDYKLNAEELSMYDLIMGLTMTLECTGFKSEKLMKDHRRGLDWFRKANPEAYMTLLD